MSGRDHPFFKLALSLRPPETPDTSGVTSSSASYPQIIPAMSSEVPRNRSYSHNTATPSSGYPAGSSFGTRCQESITLYKCPKCAPGKKGFKTEQGMRAHLASGVHGRGEAKGKKQPPPRPDGMSQHHSTQSGGKSNGPSRIRTLPNTPYRIGPELVSQYSTVRESATVISREIAGTQRLTLGQILQHIDAGLDETQVLVISLGSDVVRYVGSVLKEQSSLMGITSACVIDDFGEDSRKASCGPQIISGPLDRFKHLIEYRRLRTQNIKLVVLNQERMLLDELYHGDLFNIHRYLGLDTKFARAYIGVWTGKSGQYKLSRQSLGLPDFDGKDQKEIEKQEKIDEISLSMVKRHLGFGAGGW